MLERLKHFAACEDGITAIEYAPMRALSAATENGVVSLSGT